MLFFYDFILVRTRNGDYNIIKLKELSMDQNLQIAAYYFPNWHPEPRNIPVHGENWTEWELMKVARPRFQGHDQPKIPLWGYEDESQPDVMLKKIHAARRHGIDAFVFDWFHYAGKPYLEGALDRGFLGVPDRCGLKFALMWANHDWYNFHPGIRTGDYPMVFRWDATPETIGTVWDNLIARFFRHPDYWTVDGEPYFSIYAVNRFIIQMGGVEGTARVLELLRKKARAAGLPGVHVNAIWFDNLDRDPQSVCPQREWHTKIGFSSYTSYNVPMFTMPERPFPRLGHRAAFDFYLPLARRAMNTLPAPYYPVVTMGWDSSPRTIQSDVYNNGPYPWLPVMEPTPELFGGELRDAAALLDGRPEAQRILFVNAWNEWTEGSYLEPDQRHGFAFLDEVAKLKGGRG